MEPVQVGLYISGGGVDLPPLGLLGRLMGNSQLFLNTACNLARYHPLLYTGNRPHGHVLPCFTVAILAQAGLELRSLHFSILS